MFTLSLWGSDLKTKNKKQKTKQKKQKKKTKKQKEKRKKNSYELPNPLGHPNKKLNK